MVAAGGPPIFLKNTVFIARTDVFSDAHDEMLVNMNDQSEEVQYATIAHEHAHLYCGHTGTPDILRRSIFYDTSDFLKTASSVGAVRTALPQASSSFALAHFNCTEAHSGNGLKQMLRVNLS